jgi:hypothetical protein
MVLESIEEEDSGRFSVIDNEFGSREVAAVSYIYSRKQA